MKRHVELLAEVDRMHRDGKVRDQLGNVRRDRIARGRPTG